MSRDRIIIPHSEMVVNPMILKIFTATIDSNRPRLDTVDEIRPFLSKQFADYLEIHSENATRFIHRYPTVQCKIIQNRIVIIGINEGAEFLYGFSESHPEIRLGEIICTFIDRDHVIRNEIVGTTDKIFTYEFLTSWIALNQQNAKKFYLLKGKLERDTFIHRILTQNLTTLVKSLGCETAAPIICTSKIRFKKDRINGTNVIVFIGRFQTNLMIPDYLGIGQSVSLGFGTIKQLPPADF
jgi:hypothetical protein